MKRLPALNCAKVKNLPPYTDFKVYEGYLFHLPDLPPLLFVSYYVSEVSKGQI